MLSYLWTCCDRSDFQQLFVPPYLRFLFFCAFLLSSLLSYTVSPLLTQDNGLERTATLLTAFFASSCTDRQPHNLPHVDMNVSLPLSLSPLFSFVDFVSLASS